MSESKSRSEKFYGKGDKKGGDKKPETHHERHAKERTDTHSRHSKARDDLHAQQQAEHEAMALRHADEALAAPGAAGAGLPAAATAVQGAAPAAPAPATAAGVAAA